MQLQGVRRRIVYVGICETIAFLSATLGFIGAADAPVSTASVLSVFAAIFTVVRNLAYNSLFERWEAGRARRGCGEKSVNPFS